MKPYHSPQPKPKTNRDKKYLEWLKTQPCVKCKRVAIPKCLDIVATHSGGGMAIKGDDSNALPLCVVCHYTEHTGIKMFWQLIEYMTGKTRKQHVKEHRERWSKK